MKKDTLSIWSFNNEVTKKKYKLKDLIQNQRFVFIDYFYWYKSFSKVRVFEGGWSWLDHPLINLIFAPFQLQQNKIGQDKHFLGNRFTYKLG